MRYVLFKNCKLLFLSAGPEDIRCGESVLVRDDTICAVEKLDDLLREYPEAKSGKIIDCSKKIVMPGLIDGHTHFCNTHMNLARMFSMDYANIAKHQLITVHDPYGWHTEDSLYDISLCSALNAIKHGTTTAANCTILPDTAYRAMKKSGLRGILAPQIATSFMLDADRLDGEAALHETERCIREYNEPENGFSVVVHIHDTWDCLDSVIEKAYDMAVRYDTKFVSHFYEFPKAAELDDKLWEKEGGSFEHYMRMGIINERSVFFHGCMLNEERIEALAQSGASIIHNPDINGTNCGNCAYVPYMLKAGVNLGLGSDCGALDVLGAMKLMLIVHNIMQREYRRIEYRAPLKAATMGNAKAYGIDEFTGTIEKGKKADLITIDLSTSPELVSLTAEALSYEPEMLFFLFIRSCAGKETSETMVNGKLLREDGQFIFLNEKEIVERAARWCDEFLPEFAKKMTDGDHYAKRVYPDFVNDEKANAFMSSKKNSLSYE